MKKVFTHENRMILFNLRNLLESEGIDTRVVNEFAGGGAGDLPTFETWPELWVEDDKLYERAREIVATVLDDNQGSDWFCRGCHEKNAAAFAICWNCGRAFE